MNPGGGNGIDHSFVGLKNSLGVLFENYAMQFLNFLFIPMFPRYFVLHKTVFASGENSISTVQALQLGRAEEEAQHIELSEAASCI